MMSTGIARFFDLEAQDLPSWYARSLGDQTRVLTPDERAVLYLRAVHEKHDFAKAEYSRARSLILDAMAADIAAKLKVPEELTLGKRPTWERPKVPMLGGVARSRFPEACMLEADEIPRARRFSLADEPLLLRQMRPAAGIAPASADSRRQVDTFPSRVRVMRTISICAAAGIVVVAAFFLIRVFPMTWFVTDPHPQVAGLPSSGESSDIKEDFAKPKPKQVETTALPLGATATLADKDMLKKRESATTQISTEEIADLVKRGRELIFAGDIPSARVVLKRAAEAGDASAALELGGTYDPVVLERLEARTQPPAVFYANPPSYAPNDVDVTPDIAMARTWYTRAKELGSAEASIRLERLFGVER
jgi:hypothetical protein